MPTKNLFVTERLQLAIYLHASQKLCFSHCENSDKGKVQFVFFDPSGVADQLELEFENGAAVVANSLFASQKFLRRKMSHALNLNNRKTGAQYGFNK